eukprot:826434-Rhodomonas_salina.1
MKGCISTPSPRYMRIEDNRCVTDITHVSGMYQTAHIRGMHQTSHVRGMYHTSHTSDITHKGMQPYPDSGTGRSSPPSHHAPGSTIRSLSTAHAVATYARSVPRIP